VLLLLLVTPLVIGIMRINELFALKLRNGRLRKVRGRLPRRLLSDLADVFEHAGIEHADLRCVTEDGRAAIYVTSGAEEMPAALRQRLRNTISLWPVAKIRNAPR
jgi:hypothetical protein